MTGILIEGICASGKSTLLRKLTQREWYIEKQTKIQLSEYLTERIVENLRPTVDKRVELLEGYVDIFEKVHFNFYNSRFKNTESDRVKPFFIGERFHLTHSVEVGSFTDFQEIDRRLRAMDMKLVLLTMDEAVIRKRIEDTFPRRPETWKNYCLSFGSMEDVAKRYWHMQQDLLKFAEESQLEKIVINTSAMAWDQYILQIEEFIKRLQ